MSLPPPPPRTHSLPLGLNQTLSSPEAGGQHPAKGGPAPGPTMDFTPTQPAQPEKEPRAGPLQACFGGKLRQGGGDRLTLTIRSSTAQDKACFGVTQTYAPAPVGSTKEREPFHVADPNATARPGDHPDTEHPDQLWKFPFPASNRSLVTSQLPMHRI